GLAAGVALAPDIALVEAECEAAVLLSHCVQSQVAPQSLRVAGGRARAVLSLQNLHDSKLQSAAGLRWREDLAAATAVGRRLLAAGGVAAAAAALADAKIPVEEVDATDVRVTFFV